MFDNLAALTGQPTILKAGGREYELRPLTIEDLGALQAWLDRQKADPFEAVAAQVGTGRFTPAQEKYLLAQAVEVAARPGPKLGTPEADVLLGTLDGYVEVAYLSLRKADPKLTREDARRAVMDLGAERMGRLAEATQVEMVVGDPKAPGSAGVTAATAPSTGGASSTV